EVTTTAATKGSHGTVGGSVACVRPADAERPGPRAPVARLLAMETRREPEPVGEEPAAQQASEQPADLALEPAQDELGPVPDAQVAEEAATHHAIPRVRPRTTEELDREPPPRRRYRTPVLVSLRELLASRELLLTFVERD